MDILSIPQKTIQRILRFTTNPIPMMDARNKLEIFAVKTGLKPAYLGNRDVKSTINDNLDILKQLAAIIGLKYKITGIPPLYFLRRPNVPNDFINAYFTREDFDILWIYNDPKIESKIRNCLSGELNEGYVLGYPECCIKWHEEKRVLEVESAFNQNMHKWERITDKHLFGTWKKYPFAPHWACSKCLNGQNQETERLNNQYRELARKIGVDFEKDFIARIKKVFDDVNKPFHPAV